VLVKFTFIDFYDENDQPRGGTFTTYAVSSQIKL